MMVARFYRSITWSTLAFERGFPAITLDVHLQDRGVVHAGLPPTRERGVTWSKGFKLQAARTSLSWLVGIGLGLAALCLMQAIDFAEIVQKAGPADRVILKSVVVLGCGAAAVYYFVLALYKAGRTLASTRNCGDTNSTDATTAGH